MYAHDTDDALIPRSSGQALVAEDAFPDVAHLGSALAMAVDIILK